MYETLTRYIWPNRLGLQNTPTASLQIGKTPSISVQDMTLNNVMATEHWGMHSTSSLPSLQGPLWTGVVAPDRVLSMDLIELNG